MTAGFFNSLLRVCGVLIVGVFLGENLERENSLKNMVKSIPPLIDKKTFIDKYLMLSNYLESRDDLWNRQKEWGNKKLWGQLNFRGKFNFY